MKKVLALLLAILMTVGTLSLIACGNEKDPDSGKKDPEKPITDPVDPVDPGTDPVDPGTDPVDPGTDPDVPDKKYLDDLPEQMDFGGEVVRFYLSDGHAENAYCNVPEQFNDGDVVEYAIYQRENLLNERLNVVLEGITVNLSAFPSKVMGMVDGGTADFDAIVGDGKGHAGLALQGYALDLNKLPGLNFSKDYWNESYTEKYNYKKKQYWGTGDGLLSLLKLTVCMYANDDMLAMYHPDLNLFDVVENGEWTTEKMYELTNGIKSEDGVADTDVICGFSYQGNWRGGAMLKSAGYTMSIPDGSKWKIQLAGPENEAIFEAVQKLCVDNNGSSAVAGHDAFKEGRAMFYDYTFELAEGLRNEDVNYSIVPCPKFREEGDYISYTFEGFPIMGVLSTLPEERYELVGAAMELYSSLGRQFLTEGYYEVALKTKYAQNTGSYRCIELVRKGNKTDFAFAWCGALNQIDIFPTGVLSGHGNITTMAASSEAAYQKLLDNLYIQLKKLDK